MFRTKIDFSLYKNKSLFISLYIFVYIVFFPRPFCPLYLYLHLYDYITVISLYQIFFSLFIYPSPGDYSKECSISITALIFTQTIFFLALLFVLCFYIFTFDHYFSPLACFTFPIILFGFALLGGYVGYIPVLSRALLVRLKVA